jgi:hypothetical protein
VTAAVPDISLRGLARTHALPAPAGGAGPEAQGDRIFVTLLSLNFMLLAFFVVLGTTASFDHTRVNVVTANVRLAFAGNGEDEKVRTSRLSARQALQAGVSQAFAEILPLVNLFTMDNSDRIDVSVPAATFADIDAPGGRDAAILDSLAQVLQGAPAGYRYVLLLSAGDASAPAFGIAHAFSARGVSAQNLMVGSTKSSDDRVNMSFMVLEGDLDDEPWSIPMVTGVPHP